MAGTLKIDQAQYAELEAFSKFSSDMDKVTERTLDKGRKSAQLLIQPQYSPMGVGEQVAILYCGTHALMREITVEEVRTFQERFLERMRAEHRSDVLDPLGEGKMTEEIGAVIESVAADVIRTLV